MTFSPQTPFRSERHLVAAALRWARANGWVPRWPETRRQGSWSWARPGWKRLTSPPPAAVRVSFDSRHLQVTRFNGATGWYAVATVTPRSVVEAADVLVALGILPPFLSSAYGLAEDRHREQIEALTAALNRARTDAQRVIEDIFGGVA